MPIASAFEARQLTTDPRNHDLDNNQNFSTDSKWLVYDTRNPGIGESRQVEKVHVETGEVVVLYEAGKGAQGAANGAGAASFSPKDDHVAFIHGPWSANGLPYDFTRRRGGLVAGAQGGDFAFADARDITPPFTPGALRGGTHRHEWDGSGEWLGYTYNDDLMKKLGTDLRTVGVTHLGQPVHVPGAEESLFEGDGIGFSVLVVRMVPDPKPGTDEISRAASDSWVGLQGYQTEKGIRQRARAFVGTLKDQAGNNLDEVFIVDIPEDITLPGECGPLEGTETTFPAPPKGCSQRRLTWTEKWSHPGVTGTCWSSPDGDWITFLAKDKSGIQQIYAISPRGGEPVQVTCLPEGVECSPRWSPDGKFLAAVTRSGSIFTTTAPIQSPDWKPGSITRLTPVHPGKDAPTKMVWSPDGKLIAFNQAVRAGEKEYLQVFVLKVGE